MKSALLFLLTVIIIPTALMSQTPDSIDIAYGSLDREKLDYWKASEANSPVVLLVTTEDWSTGSKDKQRWKDIAGLFQQNGYAVVSIDHILSSDPEYRGYPQQPGNLACAIGWAKEHASLLNADPDRLILLGASAGAHLASLHALNAVNSEENPCNYSNSLDVLGVIALSGIYDFDLIPVNSRTTTSIMQMLQDSSAYWKAAQPIESQLNGSPDTHFLLLHGTRDAFAGNSQPEAFYRFLTDNGYEVEMEILQDREYDLINDLADPESLITERVISYANTISEQDEDDEDNNPPTPTAVLPPGDPSQLKVYPNPADSDLYITLEPSSPYRYTELIVTGMDGREVLHTRRQYAKQIKLDMKHYPKGTYILSILTDRDIHQRKIMIH